MDKMRSVAGRNVQEGAPRAPRAGQDAGEAAGLAAGDGFEPSPGGASFAYTAKDLSTILLSGRKDDFSLLSLWEVETGGHIVDRSVQAPDGTRCFVSLDKKIYGLDPETGGKRWVFESEEFIHYAPLFDKKGNMYVFSDKKISAVDTKKWECQWEAKIDNHVWPRPVISDDGLIYYGDGDKAYSLDTRTGEKKAVVTNRNSLPLVGNDGNLYFGGDEKQVVAVEKKTGKVRWRVRENEALSDSMTAPMQGPDGTVYFGSVTGKVYAVDGRTGKVKWKSGTGTLMAHTPSIDRDGTVYAGTSEGRICAFDSRGKKKWDVSLKSPCYHSPLPGGDGNLYAGCEDGKLYCIDGESGKIKGAFETGAGITAQPFVDENNTVFVGSCDKRIYAVNFDTTKFQEARGRKVDRTAAQLREDGGPGSSVKVEGSSVVIGGVRIPIKKHAPGTAA